MRILLVVHGYPPTHTGGAERRSQRTARHLKQRGHDVRVMTIESIVSPDAELRWEDATQDEVLVRRIFFDYRKFPDPVVWEYSNPEIGAALEVLIQEWRPDIIHLFSGYLMSSIIVSVAAAHAIPFVVSLTDYWWLCHRVNLLHTNGTRCSGPTNVECARCRSEMLRRFRVPAQVIPSVANLFWSIADRVPALHEPLGIPAQAERRAVLMKALNRAAALIAPSQYLADFYVAHGIDRRRINVWRQGVELNYCLLRRPDQTLRVGYLGQMKQHKGIDLLLDAWSKLRGDRPRRLLLYGSATGENEYAQRIRSQIAGVADAEWVGVFSGNGVWDILAGIDLLVVPSRWVENSPNTILEAQAVGIPIVGSRLGGVAELIDHGKNGLLFTVDDADDLATQLQRILDEPELLSALARSPIPFQTVEQEVDRICELYARHLIDTVPQTTVHGDLISRVVGSSILALACDLLQLAGQSVMIS